MWIKVKVSVTVENESQYNICYTYLISRVYSTTMYTYLPYFKKFIAFKHTQNSNNRKYIPGNLTLIMNLEFQP